MSTIGKQLVDYVHEGMTVYDRRGDKVGKVSLVFSGVHELLPEGHGIAVMGVDENLLPDAIRALFPPDRVPAEVRERLLLTGFVKINAGLLVADRYALADQIESVGSDTVRLKVNKNDTIKF